MNFEMFASKKLFSNYVENYIDQINRIEEERKLRKRPLITRIDDIFKDLCDIVDAHYTISCGMEWSEVREIGAESNVIKMLNEALYNEPYSEEELNHIYCNSNRIYSNPYLDIAIKRFLFSMYETDDVEKIIQMFEKEKGHFNNYDPYLPFRNLLNCKFEDKSDIMNAMTKGFEKNFNEIFNCGGYALEIFDWVSCNDRDNDVMVSKLLTNPSVRLLGDSLLQDDEYLVVLDATNYHFIKHKDGKFFEKMRSTSN